MNFLVVGAGSIGERHLRNLLSLGHSNVTVVDSRRERLAELAAKYGVETNPNYESALNSGSGIDAVLVCTPTEAHLAPAVKALEAGAHVFIEKPISNSLAGVDALIRVAAKRRRVVLVGCNMRFHALTQHVKKMLEREEIGRVLAARLQYGQYMPDWRPQYDYRTVYSAKKAGGGIILDAIHELDYARWLFGEVESVSCVAKKVSDLEIEVDDLAEIALSLESGAVASVHLDALQRVYRRDCQIIGEDGSIFLDFSDKSVKAFHAGTKAWSEFRTAEEPNEMFLRELKHFVACARGEAKPVQDAREAKRVLEIALAAKKSSKSRKAVRL